MGGWMELWKEGRKERKIDGAAYGGLWPQTQALCLVAGVFPHPFFLLLCKPWEFSSLLQPTPSQLSTPRTGDDPQQ